MITYEEVLKCLYEHEDEQYRDFHKKLLKNEAVNIIGVRMPQLRKFSKAWKGEWKTILSFPNEYYEVTFLKCAVVGMLPFEMFCEEVDGVVALLDNWATCDCFAAPCIAKHKEEFLPYIEKYLASGKEFTRRYGLVTLLHYYVEEKYLPLILESVQGACGGEYYVMMAAAWLLAEVLVKYYEAGRDFLKEGTLTKEVQNKAIQKARESYRLSAEQKSELSALKK